MSSLSRQAFNNLIRLIQKDSRTIAFIDSSLPNCESIVQQVMPEARAIVIGSEDDGINAISKVLDTSNCLEIHIFSSGFPGCIYLGNSELSISTFGNYSLEIQNWFNINNLINSSKLGHLYFYSSNLDIGDAGAEFVMKLNQIIKAKISVSSNFLNNKILENPG